MSPSDADDLVVLATVSTSFEAEWIVGALKNRGVPAVTFGDLLQDEFAMSQKLMGLSGGVRVMVPRHSIEEARAALTEIEVERPSDAALEAAYQASRNQPGAESEESASSNPMLRRGSAKNVLMVLLGALVILFGWLYLDKREELKAWEKAHPLFDTAQRPDGWSWRWKGTKLLSAVHIDRDHDGIAEELWHYDRWGRVVAQWLDADEDGVEEEGRFFDREEQVMCTYFDANENAILERQEYRAKDGLIERWLDVDEDHRWERRESVRETDGKVVFAEEDRGVKGFVRVP